VLSSAGSRARGALAEQPDGQLLEQILAGRGEAAFEAVLRRHGPMVYRVCRRILHGEQDAEDAFQATFLVLARQARAVRKRESLAGWLHGVARRVALRAKAAAAARDRHERRAGAPEAAPAEDVSWSEARALLDAELAQLPEKWRLPLILCYLEGRTQDEAAGQIGWSQRTLRRRLDEAREALGRRLARRGFAWPAALAAVLLSDCAAQAAPSPGLVGRTVEAGVALAAGKPAAGLAAPASSPWPKGRRRPRPSRNFRSRRSRWRSPPWPGWASPTAPAMFGGRGRRRAATRQAGGGRGRSLGGRWRDRPARQAARQRRPRRALGGGPGAWRRSAGRPSARSAGRRRTATPRAAGGRGCWRRRSSAGRSPSCAAWTGTRRAG